MRDEQSGLREAFMKNTRIVLGTVTAVLLFSAGKGQDRPVHEVPRITESMQIDGVLDEKFWGRSEPLLFADNLDGSRPKVRTEARLGFDDRFLYFSFQVWDENIWSTFRERDEHLWTEEVVEVFLQADPGHPSYIELEVNPLGTMLDIFLIDVRKPIPYKSWNSSGLKWAVQVDGRVDGEAGDRSWTCEIALPLDDVVTAPNIPPKPGDRWRMNLYRVDKKPSAAGLAWSPTLKRDFHVPAMFGEIVFQ